MRRVKLNPQPHREDGQGDPEHEESFYLIASHWNWQVKEMGFGCGVSEQLSRCGEWQQGGAGSALMPWVGCPVFSNPGDWSLTVRLM